MNEVVEGTYFEPEKVLFKDYLEKWMESTYRNEVQLTSYETMEVIARTHIIPYFGYRPLASITVFDIDNFYGEKVQSGLSPAYIRKMHNLLSKAFQKARKWKLVKENPVREATPPKVAPSRAKYTWSVDECKHFVHVCMDDYQGIAFILAIFTGMRRGEILALRWRNVELDKGVIHVRENLGCSSKSGVFVKDVKTQHSNRDVFLSPSLQEILVAYKKQQKPPSSKFSHLDLVVTAHNGNYLEPRNLIRKYKALVKKADVPYINFHSLRHTHATLLMRMGENPKVVSERLGHARVGITLDIYSHTNEEMQKKTAQRFDDNFWNKETK